VFRSRRFAFLALSFAATGLAAGAALAQADFPNKPLRIVVANTP